MSESGRKEREKRGKRERDMRESERQEGKRERELRESERHERNRETGGKRGRKV